MAYNSRNTQQVREITDKLEQGLKELFESEKYKEYLRTMSKFYNYSFNNTLLIAMQKPDATLVAGYTTWQKSFGRQVRAKEHSIRILAPAPFKEQEERQKVDPATKKPVLDADGKPITETVEVMRSAFKVVSVFDVSQTDGREIPDIAVDELTGSVENYAAFFEALKQESPVPIAFEDIPGGAKGYYHLTDKRIAIQEGMSEIQTIKTAIHEIAHAKLHARTPTDKAAPEEKKDSRTKEVEAESVAYTVCQRYGIETSDYSFGYIAGWSSGKETKELKGSLETIRSTAAEMIESVDEKLKLLLAEKEKTAEAAQETQTAEKPFSTADIPIYREMANYAYEAGELDAYRASMKANVECRDAIEQAISDNYSDNRLDSKTAVKDVLEQFGAARVQYVLANTVQHKDWDGRISRDNKEWAKTIEVCPENSERFIVDKAHTGLTDLFINAVMSELADREAEQAINAREAEFGADGYRAFPGNAKDVLFESKAPETVFKLHTNPRSESLEDRCFIQQYQQIENGNLIPGAVLYVGEPDRCRELLSSLESGKMTPDELRELGSIDNPPIVSIEKTVVEVKSPVTENAEMTAAKHRLTPEEKQIKAAVMDTLKGQIAHSNDGMLATYRASEQSWRIMTRNNVRIEGNTVTQNGEPLFAIHRRFSAKKTQGCYRELMPTLEYVRKEKQQEKPSIREQLKAAAKNQPERKAPAKNKKHDVEL